MTKKRSERLVKYRNGLGIVHIFIASLVITNISSMHFMTKYKTERDLYVVENDNLQDSVDIANARIANIIEKDLSLSVSRVKITGYHPASGGINSDSNPSITATMTPHKVGYTAAISTELVEKGWLGKEIYIRGFGIVLANDRLNPKIKGAQIDLCKGSYRAAMKVGTHKNVLATVINRGIIIDKMEEN